MVPGIDGLGLVVGRRRGPRGPPGNLSALTPPLLPLVCCKRAVRPPQAEVMRILVKIPAKAATNKSALFPATPLVLKRRRNAAYMYPSTPSISGQKESSAHPCKEASAVN
jgi:hypothetical protein